MMAHLKALCNTSKTSRYWDVYCSGKSKLTNITAHGKTWVESLFSQNKSALKTKFTPNRPITVPHPKPPIINSSSQYILKKPLLSNYISVFKGFAQKNVSSLTKNYNFGSLDLGASLANKLLQKRLPLHSLLCFSLSAGHAMTVSKSDAEDSFDHICNDIQHYFQPYEFQLDSDLELNNEHCFQNFEIGEQIGKGCSSAVYSARPCNQLSPLCPDTTLVSNTEIINDKSSSNDEFIENYHLNNQTDNASKENETDENILNVDGRNFMNGHINIHITNDISLQLKVRSLNGIIDVTASLNHQNMEYTSCHLSIDQYNNDNEFDENSFQSVNMNYGKVEDEIYNSEIKDKIAYVDGWLENNSSGSKTFPCETSVFDSSTTNMNNNNCMISSSRSDFSFGLDSEISIIDDDCHMSEYAEPYYPTISGVEIYSLEKDLKSAYQNSCDSVVSYGVESDIIVFDKMSFNNNGQENDNDDIISFTSEFYSESNTRSDISIINKKEFFINENSCHLDPTFHDMVISMNKIYSMSDDDSLAICQSNCDSTSDIIIVYDGSLDFIENQYHLISDSIASESDSDTSDIIIVYDGNSNFYEDEHQYRYNNSTNIDSNENKLLYDPLVFENHSTTDDCEDISYNHSFCEQLDEQYPLAIKIHFNLCNDYESTLTGLIRLLPEVLLAHHLDDSLLKLTPRNIFQSCKIPLHPNLIPMLGAFIDDMPSLPGSLDEYPIALPRRSILHQSNSMGGSKTTFLVMPRFHMTLRDYLKSHQPSYRESLIIFSQLVEAVSCLNENNIAHRDLKSDNILVSLNDGDPEIVLSDFSSCLIGADSLKVPYLSHFFDLGGNAALMAPEIINNCPGPSSFLDYSKADLWSIGALAYEIFGHRNPFYDTLSNSNYADGELPNLITNGDMMINDIVKSLLHRDPNKRPSFIFVANCLQILLWVPVDVYKNSSNLESGMVLFIRWLKLFSASFILHKSFDKHDKTSQHLKVLFLKRLQSKSILDCMNYINNFLAS